MVNGQPRTKAFRNVSAYVLQNDVLLSCLTIRETFATAAQLRLSMSHAERNAIVNQLLTELGLSDVADTYVGAHLIRTTRPMQQPVLVSSCICCVGCHDAHPQVAA